MRKGREKILQEEEQALRSGKEETSLKKVIGEAAGRGELPCWKILA